MQGPLKPIFSGPFFFAFKACRAIRIVIICPPVQYRLNDNGNYYYAGVDVKSKGVEAEVTGRINEYVDLEFGFTALKLEDEQDADIYLWVPRRTVNLALSSKLPGVPQLEVGLNGKWQSDISTIDGYTNGEVRQDSYALLGAFVRWDATEHTTVRFNANNLTDEKYITSLYQVGFYGAPANYSLTFGYDF
ncbi:MAG TPA: TonB-dependent receptor [Povalibacter sp.]